MMSRLTTLRAATRTFKRVNVSISSSFFSTTSRLADASIADRCDLHIVESPYPPIDPGPHPPVPEFVTADWGSTTVRDKVAIVDGSTGETRTFREYDLHMSNIGASLKDEFDVMEDTTVALFSPNHVDYVPISLAVALCGAKMAPVNPLYTHAELATVLQKSHTKVLIAHSKLRDVALMAAKECKYVKHVIFIPEVTTDSSLPAGTTCLSSLKKNREKPLRETLHLVHKDVKTHPFLLPYSSGTTGLPKGVCLSHSNLVANLLQMDEVEGMSFPSDHKLISPLPFFHIYGFLASMLYCAWRGQEVITMSDRFDLEAFCRLVEDHEPQRAHLVPPILLGLAKSPAVDKYNMSSLKMIISAAAPLGSDTEEAVVERLDCGVKQAWGMSELSPIGTFTSDYNSKAGSIGPLVSSTFGKVVDLETGSSLEPNKHGELMIKGPQVMMGYLDDPEKTAECLSKDKWLRTGDIAYYDEDGFFYIADRLKELIKVRGYQVAPAELEALLQTHELIRDAAVVPVPDDESGEVPRAYVVLKHNEESNDVKEQEICDWVKERVAPFKRLAGGVIFIEEIPRSASGKILRRVLRDKAREN